MERPDERLDKECYVNAKSIWKKKPFEIVVFFIMHRYPVSVEERSVRQTTDHVRANQNVWIYLRTTLPYNNTI